jgi:hypothetical protein
MSSLLTYDERVALTSILTEGRVNLSKLGRMLGVSAGGILQIMESLAL